MNKDPFLDKYNLTNNKNPVIFDVGAYIGKVSDKYLDLFKSPQIYCFEPYFFSFKKLNDHFKDLNNVKCYNIGFGDKKEKKKFYINNGHFTNSFLPTHKLSNKVWGCEDYLTTNDVVELEVTTIDDFVKENNISRIDILKLDTQGTEYDILKGAYDTINNNKINLIYMEIILIEVYEGQKKFSEILKLTEGLGFELYNMYNFSDDSNGKLRQIDVIFKNK